MLFATEKNPKGPNLKQLESIEIDLSGCKLSLQLPFGNMHSLTNQNGSLLTSTNIYDSSHEKWDEKNDYRSIELLNRVFNYSAFLGQGVGTLGITINAHCLMKKNKNLFSASAFEEHIKQFSDNFCHAMNLAIKDPLLQFPTPEKITTASFGGLKFVFYTMQKPGMNYSIYHLPIFDDCHIEFIFKYGSPCDYESRWYKKANELEQDILNSIAITLTDSSNTLKRMS